MEAQQTSLRRACRVVGLSTATWRYQRRGHVDNVALLERLQAHAAVRARYGYRRLQTLVAREGIVAKPQARAPGLPRGWAAGAPPTAQAPHAGRSRWAYAHGVELRFIRPGKPIENAYVESFNGKFRDECLNEHWFVSLADAKAIIEAWRVDYNIVRPHGSLGQQTRRPSPQPPRADPSQGVGSARRLLWPRPTRLQN